MGDIKNKPEVINAADPDSEAKKVDNTTADTNPVDDANTGTENNEANDPTKLIIVNPKRPEIKVPQGRVVKVNFHITGFNYYPNEDPERPGTFGWRCEEGVPGTISDETGTQFIIVDNTHNFPISEWGVWPTLERDPLLAAIVSLMKDSAASDSESFNSEFGHAFDNCVVNGVFIKVPAGTPFVNPWSDQARPNAKVYDRPYVFAFMTGFRFEAKDARHRRLLKNIYDGMPKFNAELGRKVPRVEPMDDDPETFVELTLKEGGYLGNIDAKTTDLLIKSLSFTRS